MFGMTNNNLALASNDSLTIVLKRFYNNLPDKPYHSNGFDVEGLKINRKSEAIKKKYIQFNHPKWKKYILIDIDRPGAGDDRRRWRQRGSEVEREALRFDRQEAVRSGQ